MPTITASPVALDRGLAAAENQHRFDSPNKDRHKPDSCKWILAASDEHVVKHVKQCFISGGGLPSVTRQRIYFSDNLDGREVVYSYFSCLHSHNNQKKKTRAAQTAVTGLPWR